jgi:hypothetical protein
VKIFQVITGDIRASEELTIGQRDRLRHAFDTLAAASRGKYEYFLRGDSFQVLLEADGLRESLYIKTYLHGILGIRVRLSIGIGAVGFLAERISDSDGEAFRLSGRTLEEMKAKDQWFRITTSRPDANEEWDIHTATLDYLENSRTENQSEALYGLLKNQTQQEIAEQLGISQPSVHSRLKGTGWVLIEKMLRRYDQLSTALSTSSNHAPTV